MRYRLATICAASWAIAVLYGCATAPPADPWPDLGDAHAIPENVGGPFATTVETEPLISCPAESGIDSEACGVPTCIVDINESTPRMRQVLRAAALRPHTLIRLGPDVDLDFTNLPATFFPIYIKRCVTIESVAALGVTPSTIARILPGTAGGSAVETAPEPRAASARTPRSSGPVLRLNKNPDWAKPPGRFMMIECREGFGLNDGVRIRGFRVLGPNFGQAETSEAGISVNGCKDIEISNMEVAGWGGAALSVKDFDDQNTAFDIPEGCKLVGSPRYPIFGWVWFNQPATHWECPPGLAVTAIPPGPGGRITAPSDVRILGNYLHHNQHPTSDGGAAGYGVGVGPGSYALISTNIFDSNRHAIAANGNAGGYVAHRNLVLKGGGYHGYDFHTHLFDVHGTDNCGPRVILSILVPLTGGPKQFNCGHAGVDFTFEENAFQYVADNAIKIRGEPSHLATIDDNVFAHEGLEDDSGDDAIYLQTETHVHIGPHNIHDFDSFGKYQVCDFDGDGVDDLFLATGKNWWYSSMGEYQWSFMRADGHKGTAIAVGYFDADQRCDIVTEEGGRLMMSSGGYGDWQSLGMLSAPFDQLRFGRFDLTETDTRPAVTRRTTHVFWRRDDQQWVIARIAGLHPLHLPTWRDGSSSPKALKKLGFGDFTGDGVTDVIAVDGEHWSISEGGDINRPWVVLNDRLGDPIENLYFVDLDNDNIDEILKFVPSKYTRTPECDADSELPCFVTVENGWRVSWGGRTEWQKLIPDVDVKELERGTFYYSPSANFVGRFGIAPGGAVMSIDSLRYGRFFSPAEIARGAKPDWRSIYAY